MRTVHLRLQLAASREVYLFNCYIFFFLDTDPWVVIGATSLQITSYDFRVVRTHWLPLFWLLWDHSIIPSVWPKPFTTQSWKDALQRRIAMLLFCCCYWWWWWWYMHVCAMMYACKCTSMSLSGSGHMCRGQRRTSGGFLFFLPYCLKPELLIEPEPWLAGEVHNFGVTASKPCLAFYMASRNSKPGLHAYPRSTFSSKPSLSFVVVPESVHCNYHAQYLCLLEG